MSLKVSRVVSLEVKYIQVIGLGFLSYPGEEIGRVKEELVYSIDIN